MRFPRAAATEAAKTRLFELVAQLVDRAQRSGQLRAAGAPTPGGDTRGLLLNGFRAEQAHPLPQPPLSPGQVHRAMLTLGRRGR